MLYIGHRRDDGREQPLRDHLLEVAELAGSFAEAFGAKEHATLAGRLHDAGKYSSRGQKRMVDPENTAKVDHSTAGAQIALSKYRDVVAASIVAGHHGGLMDVGGRFSSEGDGTLRGRCKKRLEGDMDSGAFWSEIDLPDSIKSPDWLRSNPFALSLYTRMLFSCLVDADYLNTERFMNDEPLPRGSETGMAELLERLEVHVKPWFDNPGTPINEKRCDILRNCIAAGRGEQGLYTLTVPTGGGKTVSSLAFALNHAAAHDLKRIIYVIPYTSIIEQNANVFAEILGKENVLEHHSGVEYEADGDMENETEQRKVLATENWDIPIVVTTAVQFFESLFASRTSRCRKLHNIVDSVIIFDEAQMLPLSYLRPCINAIGELVLHYGATAVLCTATQPALEAILKEYSPLLKPREICDNPRELQEFFRRVHFAVEGETSEEALANSLSSVEQCLCVVNTKRTAQRLIQMLPGEGSFHLSTWMTPNDRLRILETVRNRLKAGLPCRVVSTSLIEAGVDVDFPEVWREMAGLDSVIQAAGRCNREGRREARNSAVHVFSLPSGVPKGIRPNVIAAEMAMENSRQIDDVDTIHRYFDRLYWAKGEDALDLKKIVELSAHMEMRKVAEAFHLIEEPTYTVYIQDETNARDIECLRMGLVNRQILRRLGRSAVSVYSWDYRALMEAGKLEMLNENSAILKDAEAYAADYGLKVDVQPGKALFT